MTIAICDDSVIDCLLSKFLISEYFKKHRKTCDIVTYETGAKLISDFEDGAVFDIVFMDIYVGEELGIDIAGRLRNEGYDNLLIFSTITPEYAIASYSVKANGYILKPFSTERIESVLDRVLEHYVKENNRRYKKRGATRNWWTLEKLLQCLLSDITYQAVKYRSVRAVWQKLS